jgi:hypothetical protein
VSSTTVAILVIILAMVLFLCAALLPLGRSRRAISDGDTLAGFLRDCVSAAPGESVSARAMYDAYRAYCARSNLRPTFETRFGRYLGGMFERGRSGTQRTYLDVALRDVAPSSSLSERLRRRAF